METGLIVVALVLLFLTGGKKNGTTPSNGGSATDVPGRKPGPSGRGDVWRIDADVPNLPAPAAFDYAGNGLYIDPDCQFVIEGDLFWPDPRAFVVVSEQAPTLEETLNLRDDNTVIGYVDYLVDELGITDPVEIVWRIVAEASPLCADANPETDWGEAMRIWFNDFLARITHYLDEGTIPFGGGEQ